jgi:chemotaxis protein histidine kinase CheA
MTVTPALNQDGTYVLTRNGFVVVVDDPLEDVEDVSLLTAEQLLAMQESLQGSPEEEESEEESSEEGEAEEEQTEEEESEEEESEEEAEEEGETEEESSEEESEEESSEEESSEDSSEESSEETVPKIQSPDPIPRIAPIMKAAMKPEQRTMLQILVPILQKARAMLVRMSLSKPRRRLTANRRLMKVHSTPAVFPTTLPTLNPIN